MTSPFLFVESNTTGTGKIFLHRAAELGFRPWFLTRDPNRYSFLSIPTGSIEQICDIRIIDTQNWEQLLTFCQEVNERHPLAGIFSSSEYFIATAARLANQLGLPGANHDAVAAARLKSRQRTLLDATHSTLNPRYRIASTVQLAVRHASDIGLPVIVKPTDGSGSVGVRRAASLEEVRVQAESLLVEHGGNHTEILIEQEILGPEYSVEIFNEHIVGITEKHLGPEPYFVEVGHDFPANPGLAGTQTLSEAALHAVRALGLIWGPIHVELRLSDEGPKIIEVNPRLAGDFIPELVRYATGVDLITSIIQLASGQRPVLSASTSGYAAIRFFLPEYSGCLVGINGLEQLRALVTLVDLQTYRNVGDKVILHGDFKDRIGHVIITATTREPSYTEFEQAMRQVRVRMSPES
jgi:biotin carboxylase